MSAAETHDLFEIVHTTRAMRRLKPDPVPDALIRKILEAGVCAANGGNTQRVRNKEIQRLVRLFHWRYEPEIHQRLLDLGVDDFVWRDGVVDWSVENPDPTPIANYILK